MNPLLLLGVAWLLVLLLAPLVARLACRVWGLEKPNFRGRRVPAAVGLTFLIGSLSAYAILAVSRLRFEAAARLLFFDLPPFLDTAPVFLLVTTGFGLLGLADDLWGSREVGGFGGHLHALLRGRPTTGLLKLVGGGLVALAAGWMLHGPQHPGELVLDAALIALGANTLNLLDVRPGRALFGFAFLSLPTLIVVTIHQSLAGGVLLGAVAVAAIFEWLPDTRGRAMMGDTGSNLLGASAGLAAAIELPVAGRIAFVFVIFLLNMVAERVSLTSVIERTPWLRAIDRRIGVR